MPEGKKNNQQGVEDLEINSIPGVSSAETKKVPEIHLEHLEQAEKTIEDLARQAQATKEGKTGEGFSATAPQINASSGMALPYFKEVEEILEGGLLDVFNQLTPVKQQEFKAKGEETANNIIKLLNSGKEKISQLSKKIFNLIITWLKIIPGANKFFLEQEAKIKSDQVLALKNKNNGNRISNR